MDFICGEHFKSLCDFSLDENGFNKIHQEKPQFKEPLFFVKTDYIFHFVNNFLKEPVRLLTHNSDYCIDQKYIEILNDSRVISWYAQNINIEHPKLSSIPIGVANPIWPHGNQSIIKKIIRKENAKTNLVYTNFTINTNPIERNLCLESVKRNGFKFTNNIPFEEYLNDLSSSMFSISPNGNGIDCHKTWESLYLKTIPVVTRSINSSQYKDLPILIIDSWNDLDKIELNSNLYYSLMGDFDINKLNTKNFLKKC